MTLSDLPHFLGPNIISDGPTNEMLIRPLFLKLCPVFVCLPVARVCNASAEGQGHRTSRHEATEHTAVFSPWKQEPTGCPDHSQDR